MDKMIYDALLKGLISIERYPRSEKIAELIRSTKTVYMDAISWADWLKVNKN